jgi:hypothetical protein
MNSEVKEKQETSPRTFLPCEERVRAIARHHVRSRRQLQGSRAPEV